MADKLGFEKYPEPDPKETTPLFYFNRRTPESS
jgi:hypothetical protein